jgi:hypothetical protein
VATRTGLPSGQRHLLFSCHTGHVGAFFCGETAKKPGYPLQVLETAYAVSAGFPLLSLARPMDFTMRKQLPDSGVK